MGLVPPRWLALPATIAIALGGASAAIATTIAASAQRPAQPPAPVEFLPPPPNRGAVTWLPGSWRWTGIAGAEWQWERGRYVAWPRDRATPVDEPTPPTPDGWVSGDGDGR